MARLGRLTRELQRRHVYRVAVVYAAVAFVLWQAAEIVVPALRLPDWTLTLVVVATLAGFPVAVLLAWAFDVRVPWLRRSEDAVTSLEERRPRDLRSVAVLPFANLSADLENEYFSDGVTEDIITHLCKIPELKVISRYSVMQYKRKARNLREVGQDLGVATILEGSVRRAADRVRITAQLVDVRTDEHIWAETYDRELTDIFAIQSDVAIRIADALKATLSPAVRALIEKEPTVSLDAHNSYLLGRFYWNKRTEQGFRRGLEHFEEAIEKDSSYALAHVGVADCYNLLPFYGDAHPGQAHPKAKAAALRALELDDTLAEAHTSFAFVETWYDWDWSVAEVEFKRALALNPGYASAHHWYAWYHTIRGELDEAVARVARARDLDPLSLIINTDVGDLFYYARRYDEALKQQRKTVGMDPSFWPAHVNLGRACVQKGLFREAIDSFQEAVDLSKGHPSGIGMLGYAYALCGMGSDSLDMLQELEELSARVNVPSYLRAMVHVGLGDKDQAFAWLERAQTERDSAWLVYYLKADPWADSLRQDVRFAQLLERMGLR
ncbi:MAG: tetratricopeptide repeat protein [Gemmatimonadota bacterium]|nr:MAG: tetratricopeptide repeat protein [Gemmatimonadota bacterium]